MSKSKFSEMYGKKVAPPETAAHEDDDDSLDSNVYSGHDSNRNGRPVMEFYIVHKDGKHEAFQYHDVKNKMFYPIDPQHPDEGEDLRFTHDGTAVIMNGTGLRDVFLAMVRHTLKAIHEYDGRPVKEGASVIAKLTIKKPVKEGIALVTPSKKAG